jgi:hypothetical protein
VNPGDTWTRADGCIAWEYRWRVPARSATAAWTERLRRVPLLLPGFANPATTGWVTREADVRDLSLDLAVTAADAVTEAVIPGGGVLTMRRDLTLSVVLHVDVHARLTRGRYPGNDDLADLNAPRLNAFLARLRVATRPVDLVGIRAAGRYAAQVTEYGFHPTRRGFDVPAVIEVLHRGETVHLTNRLSDPDAWQPTYDDVSVSPVSPGRYRFRRRFVFNDGSATGSFGDESIDEDDLRERLRGMFDSRGLPGTEHAVTDSPGVAPERIVGPVHRSIHLIRPHAESARGQMIIGVEDT